MAPPLQPAMEFPRSAATATQMARPGDALPKSSAETLDFRMMTPLIHPDRGAPPPTKSDDFASGYCFAF
jgi:hypothetical protein